ncbi:DUF294 nucleotidyltransferase-like domain-containing protein [Blastopirellula marina]|uniref:Nucleotidyltransferase domain-containing protein n=1 Tax=Blastopirellula marina TaxID=124 RepID=A0A2S8FWQ4_9BACT|nr:DUF294 nucleotidyltransferase-like domain-containing protein [Blastopirellula marina]PQO36612.1 nucleotidyltransferase domain-containing protein [Blastopirellula marina]PTL44442.1 nucleotidyltransferase domain-containing protein [Blastopirellula marina]
MIDFSDSDSIKTLSESVGQTWPAIEQLQQESRSQLAKLRQAVASTKPPSNTATVVFGSLAREEWTRSSDTDWTFLIDGPSDIEHFRATENIRVAMAKIGIKDPGATQTFGTMCSSHPLVHHIGGIEDSNQNMTRRLLLLLESVALDSSITQERVVRAILERYIFGDPPASNPKTLRVPLFLLNDIVRMWRTLTVDYAAKKWQRGEKGWAIRNVKLRMSRKLLFVKGLLVCFACHPSLADNSKSYDTIDVINQELMNRCYALCQLPALSILASALHYLDKKPLAIQIMDAYDRFLSTLKDEEKRKHLEELSLDNSNDSVFEEQRQISRDFRDGLIAFFFDSDERITQLVKRYGVF